jgi:hypothetical protein
MLNNIMENIENISIETTKAHGGARPGAGRPKNTTNRLTAKEILDTTESMLGKPFVVSLIEGYIDSINTGDTKNRITYEKIILDKTATTIIEAEVTNSQDDLDLKKAAFAEALAKLVGVGSDAK